MIMFLIAFIVWVFMAINGDLDGLWTAFAFMCIGNLGYRVEGMLKES